MSISIDSNLLLSTYQNEQRQVDNKLGQDAFMKILMAELQNQDPMNPMQDKDFIAQLATFSQLEELTGMSDSLDSMNAIQQQNQLLSFQPLLVKK
ncbi:flagellar hook assembly protein FlgD [Bacillus coahuilensis]|uniref:flagellar hook assembly protein FlgD n=1 Tax=Bacillus coahuilensis TaxID=408580 RepID=UPI0001850C8C|nr:flagellar hook capping FlgD N-terminal domain-containing protein [Bacillus coahuilensis]